MCRENLEWSCNIPYIQYQQYLKCDLNMTFSFAKRLLNHGFSYVLSVNVQRESLRVEIGISRQSSGGRCYISLEQKINSLHL